ncbi:hypothetical protein JCM10914A_19320 [Paenibacillus sp. JCM 10914]|nr:D-alanyl-D-alanine carboxypeptidase [Paenibacillus sp. JCM 10914]
MKKRWLWIVIIIIVLIPIAAMISGYGERAGFKPRVEAKAVVLMDMSTGRILYSQNGDVPLPPAGMAKLMTELVILDDIKSGLRTWDDEVQITGLASKTTGAKLALKHGEVFTVRELFQSMAVYNTNDASVALAEHFAGSEEAFVRKMNDKARKIGLSDQSRFVNTTGVDNKSSSLWPLGVPTDMETVMTAEDIAKLTAHLITNHPDILSMSSKTQMKLSGRNLYLSNTNWMLSTLGGPYSYEGTDGLKTGYSANAGYCFTGTAEQQGTRLIAVIMGTES